MEIEATYSCVYKKQHLYATYSHVVRNIFRSSIMLGQILSKLVLVWWVMSFPSDFHQIIFQPASTSFISLIWMYINQVTALSNVEVKKRFEFLEAVSETMAAHLRYFKQVTLNA